MGKQRQKLLVKHQRQLEHFALHANTQNEHIKQSQDVKMQAVLARQAKLENEIEQCKNSQVTTLPPMASASPDVAHLVVLTPRTATRYSSFKKVVKGPVITIKPLGNITPCKRKRAAVALENRAGSNMDD
jgi:hypothetical protein